MISDRHCGQQTELVTTLVVIARSLFRIVGSFAKCSWDMILQSIHVVLFVPEHGKYPKSGCVRTIYTCLSYLAFCQQRFACLKIQIDNLLHSFGYHICFSRTYSSRHFYNCSFDFNEISLFVHIKKSSD
jgi:hypothetical protein